MPYPAPESLTAPDQPALPASRRNDDAVALVLTELNLGQVVYVTDEDDLPLDVVTFGTMREVCPKCRQGGLKLILRQSSVRVAHLFCADCATCYDAQYPDGAPALAI